MCIRDRTNKELEDYLIKNYGEKRVKQDDIQQLLKGEATGLKLVKKDSKGKTYLESVGSIENITNNIERTGDVAAANYKKHEGLHMITDALSFTEGNKIRNEVMNELKNSTDPKMRQAYNNVKNRMQVYKGEYKGKGRNTKLMNEFFAALNDSLFDTEIRDLSLNDKTILQKIKDLNEDTSVSGILVQLPLPKHIDKKKVIDSISPNKDVDGFHPMNVGNLSSGYES